MDQLTLATAFKMIIALGFVTLIFGASIFVVKRFSGRAGNLLKRSGRGSKKPLEILSFQNLGPGKNLYIVQCLDKKILIGATNTQITSLANLSDDDLDNEESFESSLVEKTPEKSESSFKNQFGSNLKDIARV